MKGAVVMRQTTGMPATPGLDRRRFCAAAAATLAAGPLSLLGFPGRSEAMTTAAQPTASDATAIRPFRVHFPDEALADLKHRIAATRWPDKEVVTDQSQGVQLATVQKLARYWGTDYNWRKVEAKLNALPQFTTEIDGVDIHFIHVRSK